MAFGRKSKFLDMTFSAQEGLAPLTSLTCLRPLPLLTGSQSGLVSVPGTQPAPPSLALAIGPTQYPSQVMVSELLGMRKGWGGQQLLSPRNEYSRRSFISWFQIF